MADMKVGKALIWGWMAWLMISSGGCLVVYHGDKITREQEERRPVKFESEEAARLFNTRYEQHRCTCEGQSIKHENMVIPFITATDVNVKLSSNACYNDALSRCDVNGDGTITDTEAKVYSGK